MKKLKQQSEQTKKIHEETDVHFEDQFYSDFLDKFSNTIVVDRDIFFIQIGAFDGILYDDLNSTISNNKKYKGILVEPNYDAFSQLLKTYEHRKDDFIFENSAITEKNEIRSMKTINYSHKDNENIPKWAVGCGTLLATNALFGYNCTLEQLRSFKDLVELKLVNCINFSELLKKHNVDYNQVDILHIDAEGYDWRIIKQLNLEVHRPYVIYFEFFNLSEVDYVMVLSYLELYGYRLIKLRNNILATTLKLVPDNNSNL